VRLLLTRPGFLSREHFEGRRAPYISPIRLYLVFSLLFFAISAAAPMTTMGVTVTPDAGESPQDLERRRKELEGAANEAITHTAPRAMFVLVPLFAGLVALAVRRPGALRRNYPQHLYFALLAAVPWLTTLTSRASRAVRIPMVAATGSRYRAAPR
jgi:hypothetical protein